MSLLLNELEPDMGIVYQKHLGTYNVHTSDGRVVTCALSSTLRKVLHLPPRDPNSLPYFKVYAVSDPKVVDPVAVGDVVRFREGANDGGSAASRTGMITDVVDRQNRLTRLSPGNKPIEQVVVANVDRMIVITAGAKPVPDLMMLDRFLMSAESAGIPAVLVFTKFDEAVRDYVRAALDDYRAAGYPVLTTSAVNGQGVDEFRALLAGSVSVLVGVSGAGKTSLLNAAQPELGLRVKAVNQRTGEGRHTTTHLQMFPLAAGGAVVDTPGMREFNLWDIAAEDLAALMPEMRPHLGGCKFGAGCLHRTEPGCAVKAAVARGDVPEMRYRSYVKIVSDYA